MFTGFRGYGVAVGGELTLARVNDGKLRYENNTWSDFGLNDGTLASLTLNGSAEELLLLAADRSISEILVHFSGSISRTQRLHETVSIIE